MAPEQPGMPSEPYQSVERLRARIEHQPTDLFDDNAEKRFDRLLGGTESVGDAPATDADGWRGLEYESRKYIETLYGDQPLNYETGRTDELRPTYEAAIPLVHPVDSVSQVEYKYDLGGEWRTLDAERYTWSRHNLILEHFRAGGTGGRAGTRRNTAADFATRASWGDLAAKLRVTYDRGYDPVPGDIQSVQVQIVNRMLRLMRLEQNLAAASPEEWQGVSPEFDRVITDAIRERIGEFTTPSGATLTM